MTILSGEKPSWRLVAGFVLFMLAVSGVVVVRHHVPNGKLFAMTDGPTSEIGRVEALEIGHEATSALALQLSETVTSQGAAIVSAIEAVESFHALAKAQAERIAALEERLAKAEAPSPRRGRKAAPPTSANSDFRLE
ncbi:MAG: hypothetical protein AB7S70_00675 [Hyphomicrobium sp.]|uniref:hypothetical protein n=1 Tax=Hyphomicrobium sp. TaxID=82 RepID=UPI003D0C8D49